MLKIKARIGARDLDYFDCENLMAARYQKLPQLNSETVDMAYRKMTEEIIQSMQEQCTAKGYGPELKMRISDIHFETHFVDGGMAVTGYGTLTERLG